MFHFFKNKKRRAAPQKPDRQGLPVDMLLLADGSTGVRTLEPLRFRTSDGVGFLIPRGFVSDGASLPRFFWRVIGHPFDMRYLRPALLHDWLYRAQIVPRAFADRVFFDLLRYRPRMRVRRYLIYAALRLFGGFAWRSNAHKLARGVPLIEDGFRAYPPDSRASAFIPDTRFAPRSKR